MTLHDVDSERLAYLVRQSFSGAQLREFFTTQQKKLMVAHEKVQNLPRDLVAAVSRFSPQAHGVMRSWLVTQPLEGALADDQLVPRFRSVEELGVKYTNDEAAHLARSALRALYRESPPTALLEFLRTPIPDGRPISAEALPPGVTVAVADWEGLLQASDGKAPQGELADAHIQVAVALLLAAQKGDLSAIPQEWEGPRAALQSHVVKRRVAESVAAPPKGITRRLLVNRGFDPRFDYTAVLVVATRTKSTFKQNVPWFGEAEAFIHENDIYTMEGSEFRRALPATGEIVIHRDRGIPEPPINEPRPYSFELVDTHLAGRAFATSFVDRLLPVVPMPCASSDAPTIRDFITAYAKHASSDSAIFVTTDDLCVRPRDTSLGRVHLPAFDWVLECWSHLVAYEFAGGTFVLNPLPRDPSLLDCGPLATVAKRVLAQLKTKCDLGIPKASIALIAEHLSDSSSGLSSLTRERLLNNLRLIESSGDDYEQLVASLLSVPKVSNDVAARTQQVVEERLAQSSAEKQKIENLRRRAADLEAAIRKLAEDRDNAVKEIRLAVRKAFTAATSKEAAALGELSLIAAMLPVTSTAISGAGPSAADDDEPQESVAAVRSGLLDKSSASIQQVLATFGLESQHVSLLAEALAVAARAGGFIVFDGAGANELAAQYSCAIARVKVRVVDVVVGLVDSVIEPAWLTSEDADVLILRNANLSDMSAYSPELIAHVTHRLTACSGRAAPTVVLAGSTGPASVPWPTAVDEIALAVSLASLESAVADSHNPLKSEIPSFPMRRLLEKSIERQADVQEVTNDVRTVLRSLMIRSK